MCPFHRFVYSSIPLSLKSHYIVSVVSARYVPCAKGSSAGHEEGHELDYTEQDYSGKEQFVIGHVHSKMYSTINKYIKEIVLIRK